VNIEWLENGYTDHGCKILPYGNTKVGKIDYNAHTTNHDFGGAYKRGGLFEWLVNATLAGIFGLILGAIIAYVVTRIAKARKGAAPQGETA
jgi:predicted DNA repair protein MutK